MNDDKMNRDCGTDSDRGMNSEITCETLWQIIAAHQGEVFYTAKGLPFTYVVRGGEFFTERKKKSITRATFEKAFLKLQADTEGVITGPKKLNVFGAPYVFAVFRQLGIAGQEAHSEREAEDRDNGRSGK